MKTTYMGLAVGDRIRRVALPFHNAPLGFETVVTKVRPDHFYYLNSIGEEVHSTAPYTFEVITQKGFQRSTVVTFEGKQLTEMDRERLLEVVQHLGEIAYPDIFKVEA